MCSVLAHYTLQLVGTPTGGEVGVWMGYNDGGMSLLYGENHCYNFESNVAVIV